jgi:hypothetical protein
MGFQTLLFAPWVKEDDILTLDKQQPHPRPLDWLLTPEQLTSPQTYGLTVRLGSAGDTAP